jgi:hypothetical protein
MLGINLDKERCPFPPNIIIEHNMLGSFLIIILKLLFSKFVAIGKLMKALEVIVIIEIIKTNFII